MKILLLAMFTLSAVYLSAQTGTQAKPKTPKSKTVKVQYTCTMHPEVISDKPGNCPKCGMELVKMQPKADMKKGGMMKMRKDSTKK